METKKEKELHLVFAFSTWNLAVYMSMMCLLCVCACVCVFGGLCLCESWGVERGFQAYVLMRFFMGAGVVFESPSCWMHSVCVCVCRRTQHCEILFLCFVFAFVEIVETKIWRRKQKTEKSV